MATKLIKTESELEKSFDTLCKIDDLVAIKAEFEAEGTRIEELIILAELCSKRNIKLTLKVGGPSSERDFYEAFQLGTNNILVPMVESEFSLLNSVEIYLKFLPIFKHLKKVPKLFINIESINAIKNLENIFNTISNQNLPLSGIVIGRSDLAASLNISDTNSKDIEEISEEILKLKNTFDITLGGNVTNESYEFIQNLTLKGLNCYETRKCTFKTNKMLSKNKFQDILLKALEFEFKWLNYKKSFYSIRSNFDESRINIIKSRINL